MHGVVFGQLLLLKFELNNCAMKYITEYYVLKDLLIIIKPICKISLKTMNIFF